MYVCMLRATWGAIGVSLLMLSSCGRFFTGAGIGHSVTVAKVEERRTSPEITVAATLIPSDRATIAFPQPVRIKKFSAQIGAHVVKGDPLLELDDMELRTHLRQLTTAVQETKTTADQNRFLFDNRDRLRAEGKLTEIQSSGLEKEIAADAAKISRLEADVAVVEQSLAHITVASPLDGMVVDRPASVGLEIGAKQSVLEIVNINPILAAFRLSADESGGITLGDAVKVRIDELPGESFDAHVSFVGPELQSPNNTFAVWASIANPLESLKSGMHAFTEFRSSKEHNVHVVPASAILMQQNRPHVFVIGDGIAKLTSVNVKSITDKEAILISGVKTGEWVVTRGQEGLDDGMVVDIR